MQAHFHAIVWIDHKEAKVIAFDHDDVERTAIHPHNRSVHLHHKANEVGSGNAPVDKDFMGKITTALDGAGTILIVGPASAKTEFAKYLAAHAPDLSARVAAVEAADHPTDGELLTLAKHFFKGADRMHPPA